MIDFSVRHRQSNLVGNVLNVNTGDWVRRESGVGAGIDSYYEYVAKAYVLLGEEKYLGRNLEKENLSLKTQFAWLK